MSNLLTGFDWKDYGVKHGLDSDSKCVEHAIRASVVVDASKKPSVFDWKRYIKDHPDLQRALGKGRPVHVNDATCHYLSHGIKENRKKYILGTNEPYVYDFDWKMYDKLNPDVFTQRHRTNVGEWHCFRHWCDYGYKEDRKTGVCKQLVVKTDALISTDGEVNKRWIKALSNIILPKYITVDKLIYSYINHTPTTISDYKCINIENKNSYNALLTHSNGDNLNESNFIKTIQQNGVTLYFNNIFISGNKSLVPEITISRNKEYSNVVNKQNVFLSQIPYKPQSAGSYFITKSMIDAVKDDNSLLYPHVYDKSIYNEISMNPMFLHEQVVDKSWYTWASDDKIKELKLKHFDKDAFVICICGRIAINNYPKSLLEAIKLLRAQGHNIHLLALAKFEVRPERLTQNLYDEITSYDWVKSFIVDKKDVLNYFRICDVLASTYRDYCNHVGGSNKIKEYLLCNKPILCSRGKERERELGKDYIGLYDCETCNTVPPLCWTREYLKNPNCYINQYNTYFKNVDINLIKEEINQIFDYISKYTKIVDLKSVITKLNLKNIVICPGLKAFARIKDCYNLTSDYDINKPTIFFGCYSMDDVNAINNHKGLKFIMFGGNDCNLNSKHRIDMFEAIDFNKNVSIISTSNDMYNRLVTLRKKYNLSNTIYKSNLNLLDPNIWKEINILENFVYVYDGCMKKTEVYSSDICDDVIDILTKKYKTKMNFIRTSDFKSFISQEELFKLYQKCFIGMRLTYHDGSAQTVMEFNECNLPIIHNQSDYGINWKDENDIVKTIENEYKKNLVSIIVPTFNRIDLLKETVNAILKQTYQIFEILIINDCSKDYNFETYKQLEGLDDRITVYNLEHNLGAAGLVRNYGIEKSNGTYIAFCDDDDLWIENKLEKQLLSLKNTNFDMCSTNAYKLENGIKTNTKLMPDFNKYPEELTFDFLTDVYPKGNIICTSSVLLKKSILKYKFSSKKYSEDYGQWLSILNDGKKIYFLNEPLLHYRIDGNNKQSNEKNQKLKILIYQGINAYRCYKYTKLLSQMGYTVDCCYSYQDFSFHHGKDGLDTNHINKLFKINSYDEYFKISKNYDILVCVDIIDATPGNIHVGYNNYKQNIKTIYLIGDLFLNQKGPDNLLCKMECEVLNNINPSLIIFSGRFLKQGANTIISKLKYSNVILNTPLKNTLVSSSTNIKYNDGNNIKIVLVSSITTSEGHFYNYINVLKTITNLDNRIIIDVYIPVSNMQFQNAYNIKNVNIKGNISLYDINTTLRNYHIGLIYFDNNISKSYLPQVNAVEPNKLYDYYFAQLPILCSNNSVSLKQITNENNLGITIDLKNEQNLYSKLSNLIKNYKFKKNVYSSFDDETNEAIIRTVIRKY